MQVFGIFFPLRAGGLVIKRLSLTLSPFSQWHCENLRHTQSRPNISGFRLSLHVARIVFVGSHPPRLKIENATSVHSISITRNIKRKRTHPLTHGYDRELIGAVRILDIFGSMQGAIVILNQSNLDQ